MNASFPDDLLSAYLDGEVTVEQQALIERRLEEDAELRKLCDQLRVLQSTLQALPTEQPAPGLADRVLQEAQRRVGDASADLVTAPAPTSRAPAGRWRLVLGTAASLAALLLVTVLVVQPWGQRAARRVATGDPTGPSPPPAASAGVEGVDPAASAPQEETAEVDELPLVLGESVEQEMAGDDARRGGRQSKASDASQGYGGRRPLASDAPPSDRPETPRASSMQPGQPSPASVEAGGRIGAASLGRGAGPGAAPGGATADLEGKSKLDAMDRDRKQPAPTMESPSWDQQPSGARARQGQAFSWVLDAGRKDQQEVRQLAQQLREGQALLVQVTWHPADKSELLSAAETAPAKGERLEQLTQQVVPLFGTDAPKELRFKLPDPAAAGGGGLRAHPEEKNILIVEGPQASLRQSLQRLLERSDIGVRVVPAPRADYYRAVSPNDLTDSAAGIAGAQLEKQLSQPANAMLLLFQVTPPTAAAEPQQDDSSQPQER